VKVLNLGCGRKPIADAVNHDRTAHHAYVDVAWDLNDLPWPWEDKSFDQIAALSVFEHLDIDLQMSLDECHRILRPGGRLIIKLPMWDSERAHDDCTHRWYFTLRSLDQFCPETRRGEEYAFYTECRWRYVKPPKKNDAGTSLWATLEAI